LELPGIASTARKLMQMVEVGTGGNSWNCGELLELLGKLTQRAKKIDTVLRG